MEALVFDLDGTISDPAVGIGRCVNYALRHHGHPAIADADVPRYIGPPLDESFAALVRDASAQHIDALIARYRERYAEIGYAENTIYAGIPEALDALRHAGATLGICTSKRADFAERILAHFGIRHHFAFVSGGDTGIRKADQLASLLRDRVIDTGATMIGDRAIDVLAAKANGLRSVAVLWGHGGLAELRAADPDALLESPADLPEDRRDVRARKRPVAPAFIDLTRRLACSITSVSASPITRRAKRFSCRRCDRSASAS